MSKNKCSALAAAVAALCLCLCLGVAVAQQSPATTAPAAADAAKSTAAVAGEAAKPTAAAAGAAKAVDDAPKVSKLAAAIAKAPRGTEKGQLDDSKPLGFLGIPGAPTVNPILAFCWAVWVGWIFSTVGAFGGVMAGVGHMSIFGFGSFAGPLKKTAPELGRIITDSIKISNQFMGGLTAAISSFNYMKMGRLVLPLAICLGLGSLIGAWGAQELSAGKLDFKSYQGYFGLFVLVLGSWLLYETTPGGQAKKQTATKAARAFEDAVKKQKCGETVEECNLGMHVQKFNLTTCEFTFYGVPFKFNPLFPFMGGVAISAVAAFLGVGGGFLLVPFLTSVTQLPMYLAAGTSALAVLISMITSIITLLSKGTSVEWGLIGIELAGVAAGSIVGPMTSKYLSDKLMKRLFIVLSFYIGTAYLLAGFFSIKIPGV